MKKLSIKEIDLIIETALGNISLDQDSMGNIDINKQTQSTEEDLKAITEPVFSFLDGEEKGEKDKIQNNSKIKSIINDPTKRKVKDMAIKDSQKKLQSINQTKTNLMAKQEEMKKKAIETQKALQLQMDQIKQSAEQLNQLRGQVQEMYDKNISMPILKRAGMGVAQNDINEMDSIFPQQQQQQQQNQAPAKKAFKVKFESKSGTPFEVLFSERGFRINDTRLSFEIIEDALSKNFIITLNNGDGLVLDAVRMQKLLKYKHRVV